MLNDKRGNAINVCLFESYLAKFCLENSIFFEPLYQKIFSEIDNLIEDNKNNGVFPRRFFSCESSVKSQYHHINDYQDVKKSKSLPIYDTFLKFLCEVVLDKTDNLILSQTPTPNNTTSLAQSSGFMLFGSPPKTVKSIGKFIRDDIMFKPSERGCIEVDNIEDIEDKACLTNKLGILQPDDTPSELQNYFQEHFSAQFVYKTKEDSFVAKWLRQHHLPIISGTSGSAEKIFSQLSRFIELNQIEASQLFLTMAACMVALGHHSFFEVMLVADKVGLKLEAQDTLLDFYLQCIPQTIQNSQPFKSFIDGPTGGQLLKEYQLLNQPGDNELTGQSLNNTL